MAWPHGCTGISTKDFKERCTRAQEKHPQSESSLFYQITVSHYLALLLRLLSPGLPVIFFVWGGAVPGWEIGRAHV